MTANTNNKHREETRDETRDRLLKRLNILTSEIHWLQTNSEHDADHVVLETLQSIEDYTKSLAEVTAELRALLEA